MEHMYERGNPQNQEDPGLPSLGDRRELTSWSPINYVGSLAFRFEMVIVSFMTFHAILRILFAGAHCR